MIQHLEHLSQIFHGAKITMEVDEGDLTLIQSAIITSELKVEQGVHAPDGKDAIRFTLNSTEFIIKKK